jgi:hypothetical protein
MQNIDQPVAIRDLGINPEAFEDALPHLIANSESDTSVVMGDRIPDNAELEQLLRYAYVGKSIDF